MRVDSSCLRVLLIGAAASLVGTAVARAAEGGGSPAKIEGEKPAKMETVAGSDTPRITLTAKAAQRLDIQSVPVREERVKRWLVVGGEVEAAPAEAEAAGTAPAANPPGTTPTSSAEPSADATASPSTTPAPPPTTAAVNAAPSAAKLVVRVSLAGYPSWTGERQQVYIVPADVDDEDEDGENDDEDDSQAMVIDGAHAKPIEAAAHSAADPSKVFYYRITAAKHSLAPGQRVRVKMPQPESNEPHKVVPYSSVIYDNAGATWAYTNPEPLVFVRQPVTVAFIQGDLAVLSEGPAVGAKIVTVGAQELYAVENKVGY